MSETTTVKIRETTKSSLDDFKGEHETYDDAISNLISTAKNKDLKKKLIEGYKRTNSDNLKILKEWEFANLN